MMPMRTEHGPQHRRSAALHATYEDRFHLFGDHHQTSRLAVRRASGVSPTCGRTGRTLVIVGPLPPPLHGVTVSTSLVLANDALKPLFDVVHFDTSDHRSRATVGKWDARNAILALGHAWLLNRLLPRAGRAGVVYLPMSSGLPGFLRDSLLIHVAHQRGWRVAGHFRNGDFHTFFRRQRRLVRWWMS